MNYQRQADFGNTIYSDLGDIITLADGSKYMTPSPYYSSYIAPIVAAIPAIAPFVAKVGTQISTIAQAIPAMPTSVSQAVTDISAIQTSNLWENYKAPICIGIGYAIGKFSIKGAIAGLIIYAIASKKSV